MQTIQHAADAVVVKIMQDAMNSGLSLFEFMWAMGCAGRAMASQLALLSSDAAVLTAAEAEFLAGFQGPPQFAFVGSDSMKSTASESHGTALVISQQTKFN